MTVRRWRFPAAAARDDDNAVTSVTIEVPELPQLLRFDFIRYRHDTGEQKFLLVGLAVERRISIREANETPDGLELTQEQLAIIWKNLHAYRRIAEGLFIPLGKSAADAAAKRAGMARRDRSRDAWTDDELALLVSEYRGFGGAHGRVSTLADARGVDRRTIHRALRLALKRGFISETELPTRRPAPTG